METDVNNGIFEENLLFTIIDISSGNKLKLSDGDTASISYLDNTLLTPVNLSTNGINTFEIKNIVAIATIFDRYISSTERTSVIEPILVNSFGERISQAFKDEQLFIQSEITNSQMEKQTFSYIVQVKDSEGIIISLSWITSELLPEESLLVARSWFPLTAGSYFIEIFVWDKLTDATSLSPTRTMDVQVLE